MWLNVTISNADDANATSGGVIDTTVDLGMKLALPPAMAAARVMDFMRSFVDPLTLESGGQAYSAGTFGQGAEDATVVETDPHAT